MGPSAKRVPGISGLGADCGVEIPSNLFISSGCLGLSGLNVTDCACDGSAERPASGSGGGGLVRGAGGPGGAPAKPGVHGS